MTDFASLTPEQKIAAEQAQDRRIYLRRNVRLNLDNALANFNRCREEDGLAPVTIRIPEEEIP